MKAPKKTVEKWKLQREHGDIEKLSLISGISRTTLSNAMNNGRMNQTTFDSIESFFKAETERTK